MNFSEELATAFEPHATLTPKQLKLLNWHFELLLRWNQRINLTRITEQAEAVRLHYCESLYLALKLPTGPLRIADIGSGPGFPGFPIAVLRPDVSVDLVESDVRKCAFLREVSRGINNLRVIHKRAEEIVGVYDWLVSRAVREQDILRLRLAPEVALLSSGDVGEPLPWGEHRTIATFHVER
jgi:16S rRNA (guanine(527)-N(7))-methyltransferase RsmG